MDGEGVDGDGEVLGMDLGELLAARVVFEEGVEHLVGDLLGARPVDLVHLLRVGVVRVQAPKKRTLNLYSTRMQDCMGY